MTWSVQPVQAEGIFDSTKDEIKFDLGTRSFSGKVGRGRLYETHGLKVKVEAHPSVVMDPGILTFNLRVEPDITAADISNLALGATGVVLGLLNGLVHVGQALWNHSARKDKTAKALEGATSYLASERPKWDRKTTLDKAIKKYKAAPGITSAREAARQVFEKARLEVRQDILKAQTSRTAIEHELARGRIDKLEAKKQMDALDARIDEMTKHEIEIERLDKRRESAQRKGQNTDASFEKHMRK